MSRRGKKKKSIIKPGTITPKSHTREIVQGLLTFLVGVVLGPVIQVNFFSWLPGPRIDTKLRAEQYSEPGNIVCHYYKFDFLNFSELEYLHLKIQLPNTVSSVAVGTLAEKISGTESSGNLQWSKGVDGNGACKAEMQSSSLKDLPEITAVNTDSMVTISSTSKLPPGTPIVGLIATTEKTGDASLELHTDASYEYLKFGNLISKNLPIPVRNANWVDR